MPQDEEVITTTAAERRLGGALMWTGVLLGAMFIAVLGLGFILYSSNYSETGPLKTYIKQNQDLTQKLEAKTEAFNKAQQDLRDANNANDALKKQLAAKPAPRRPAPTPDPF